MGDRVQYNLDLLAVSINELQTLGLISARETKILVQKRTNFEYVICGRRNLTAENFMRYIDFEYAFQELFRIRKSEFKLNRALKSDNVCRRHLAHIFERGIRRFPTNDELWLKYIEYSISAGSFQTASQIFLRALQMQPRNINLWIRAAQFEFSTNSNASSARVLLIHGLRINADSVLLWLHHLSMELAFATKLAHRRRKLGLNDDITADISSLVFAQAMKQVENKRDFLLLSLECISQFPKDVSKVLVDHVVKLDDNDDIDIKLNIIWFELCTSMGWKFCRLAPYEYCMFHKKKTVDVINARDWLVDYEEEEGEEEEQEQDDQSSAARKAISVCEAQFAEYSVQNDKIAMSIHKLQESLTGSGLNDAIHKLHNVIRDKVTRHLHSIKVALSIWINAYESSQSEIYMTFIMQILEHASQTSAIERDSDLLLLCLELNNRGREFSWLSHDSFNDICDRLVDWSGCASNINLALLLRAMTCPDHDTKLSLSFRLIGQLESCMVDGRRENCDDIGRVVISAIGTCVDCFENLILVGGKRKATTECDAKWINFNNAIESLLLQTHIDLDLLVDACAIWCHHAALLEDNYKSLAVQWIVSALLSKIAAADRLSPKLLSLTRSLVFIGNAVCATKCRAKIDKLVQRTGVSLATR